MRWMSWSSIRLPYYIGFVSSNFAKKCIASLNKRCKYVMLIKTKRNFVPGSASNPHLLSISSVVSTVSTPTTPLGSEMSYPCTEGNDIEACLQAVKGRYYMKHAFKTEVFQYMQIFWIFSWLRSPYNRSRKDLGKGLTGWLEMENSCKWSGILVRWGMILKRMGIAKSIWKSRKKNTISMQCCLCKRSTFK